MAEPKITEDALLGGLVRIRQPKRGYRVNVDTMLLAAAFNPEMSWGGCSFVDVGCGVGAALITIAKTHQAKNPPVRIVGIERDATYAALACENAKLNEISHQAEFIEADGLSMNWSKGSFDRVLFNPPYDYPGDGRPPSADRQGAYIAERPIGDWIKVWCNRMTKDGHLTLIHRTRRLREILDAMEGRLGGVEIFPVRPSAGTPARRIIVRARKGSRAPLKLHGGLDLHPAPDAKQKHTPQTEALLRGEAFIDLC